MSTPSPRSISQSKNEETILNDVGEEEGVEVKDEALDVQNEELLQADSWKSLEELNADQKVVK